MPGRFVSMEGGEGVGKSTVIRGLVQRLGSMAPELELVVTREPGGTPVADEIRDLFRRLPGGEELNPTVEALLVNAARKDHVDRVIRPARERGAFVICDRYADSTRVYQGHLGGMPQDQLELLLELATGGLEPDLTMVLDLDAKVMQQRVASRRAEQDRYDRGDLSMYSKMRQGYLDLADRFPDRVVVIDAGGSPADVLEKCMAEINRKGWV